MQVGEAHRRTCKRYDVWGHAHYLTFSCWRRRPFLSRDRCRRWFIDALDAARSKHPFDLWAYVIMPEHAHVLVLPHEGSGISAILSAVKQSVAKKGVRWVKENSPWFLNAMTDLQPSGRCCYRFWLPGGGYDRNIWTPQELHEKIRYIHANPVRRGLVERPEEWAWSSCRAWEEDIDQPIAIDRESLPPLQS